jgi:NodT family efflux transporter outer membrane factor (OMF) lipoprotein
MMRIRVLVCGCTALLLSGCRVPPPPPPPSAYAPVANTPADTYKEANGWQPAHPSEAAGRGPWWEIFGDPQLNALEQQIEISNQDLKAADSRFREARDLIRLNRASEFPAISVAPGISSLRDSSSAPYAASDIKPAGDFVLPFDLSYEVDIWGRVRRQVAASREEAQAVAADLESIRLILHAELAFDYFELRSADAQKRLLDQTVESYREALTLATSRFEEGASPKSDVSQARTQLDSASVADTDITVQRAQYEHAIAVLIGKPPAAFTLADISTSLMPPGIPVGLPSQLLERRPDIAAAERRVAEANEQIGIARTAFYPTVSFNALMGLEGDSISNWFIWPSRFWAVGPSMAETLFDAGRRRATSDAARAGYDASVAAYRQTVLSAFQQVEDNLAVLRILEREAQQQQEATASARESLALVTNRYREGADPYLQVLTAQTVALANERNDLDIERRRMDASVLLVKALGGGWTAVSLPNASDLDRR